MARTGIVRRLDHLGRIVLPRELRDTFGIERGDLMQVFVDENRIVLEKYAPGCVFCGELSHIQFFRARPICPDCRQSLEPSPSPLPQPPC